MKINKNLVDDIRKNLIMVENHPLKTNETK